MDPAVAADPASWSVQRWHYHYHKQYGSPRVGEQAVAVTGVRVAADRRSATLALAELKTGEIHEIRAERLRSAGGAPLLHPSAYYTLNRLP